MLHHRPGFRSLFAAIFLGCLVTLAPALCLAQTATSAAVLGTVTDPTGAVISGAEMQLIDDAFKVTLTEKTKDTGQYIFANVSPGVYRLTVTMQGFRTATIPNLKFEVAKSYTLNVSLEVGDVATIVEVTAETAAELQTTDSTVGNVIRGKEMGRFPALTRRANELLTLQPLATPGGEVAGSRGDQSTFSLDGIDVTNQSIGGLATYVQLPIDGVEEFRVGVANPSALYGRGAGGQVSIISKSGSTDLHGAVYWYHQNDNLNAHDWTSKRLGRNPATGRDRVPKPELKDNRFGFRVGGPIWPWEDRAFFFLNYDGRRFPRSSLIDRFVPSDLLRMGILQFRDRSGVVRSYSLGTAAVCGVGTDAAPATGACDPRGLGLSPTIASLWSNLPAGNNPAASGADGLNTFGFTNTVSNALNNNNYDVKLDYNVTKNWRAHAKFSYFGELAEGSGLVSIIAGNVLSREKFPNRQNFITGGLRGQITPSLYGDFRFGLVRIRTATDRFRPNQSAALLAIAGTDTPSGFVALDLGALGGTQSLLSEPIDVGTQVARKQGNDNKNYQYNLDLTWVRGQHTFLFGSHVRHLHTHHIRDDKVLGALGALVAQIDSDLGAFTLPGSVRPPTCRADNPATAANETTTINCLEPADVRNWNRLYASALGIIDNISVLAVRDAQFNPLPFGAVLDSNTKLVAPEFYFEDKWRLTPSLTLSLGLNYGWQTPPTEKEGEQTVQIDGSTLNILTARDYLRQRRQAAEQGQIFNPPIAFMPIRQSGRGGVFDTDWNNISPRLAVAWNPSFQNGFLGKLFGARKTVIRGGYSLIFDRQNTVQSVIVPTLGVAFAQTLNVTAPLCNATGAGGAGCTAASTNPALNGFRVGQDGVIPLPTVPPQTVPVSPFWGIAPGTPIPPPGQPFPASALRLFPEVLSFQVDPTIQVGENHAIDATWQRELPKEMLLEIGYAGRHASKLPQSMNFGQVPYTFLDTASGQTFAQAFDAVADQLRQGVPALSVAVQPWFESQIPLPASFCLAGMPLAQVPCTQWLASVATSSFVNGDLNSIFLTIDNRRLRAGIPPFNNYLARTLFLRSSTGRSNYNALFATLRRRGRRLLYTVNYTFSRSLDQIGAIQNAASVMPNNFDLDAEYGPSDFDFNHLLNATSLYYLPLGKGQFIGTENPWLDRVISGWYVSSIFTSSSGAPLTVTQGTQVWGGSLFLGFSSGAVPTVDPGTFENSVQPGIFGSNNIGVNANPNPPFNGTGLNMFQNPEAVFNSFRRVRLSQDGRSGRANPVRGMPRWNVDISIGKETNITEGVKAVFSADFFNLLNKVNFNNPGLSLTNQRAFGVITSQFTPPNRTVGSRWIQFSLRVEF